MASFLPVFAEWFGGWELVSVLAVVLILFGAKKLPELSQGLGKGFREFWKATNDAGDSLSPKECGFVYKALTHDNRTAEFVYPQQSNEAKTLRAMILFVAQGFGVGRIPFAPGTFGSLVGLLWFAALLATKRYDLYLLGTILGAGLSVWLCGAAEKLLKQKDPSSVVIDEIIAIPFCFIPWVTIVWLKHEKLPAFETFISGQGLLAVTAVFILFRVFDIWKPWPVRQSQNLPGGWGVTVDDVLAAIYVAAISFLFMP